MTVDEQEALSLMHGPDTWHFFQLRSGLYAVFNHKWELRACVSWELFRELYLTRDKARDRVPYRHPPTQRIAPIPGLNLNLKDLGL